METAGLSIWRAEGMTTSENEGPFAANADSREHSLPEDRHLPVPVEPEKRAENSFSAEDMEHPPWNRLPGGHRQPGKAFVRSHAAHFIAFGGGVGSIRTAPGTAGTLVAIPLFWLLDYALQPLHFLLLIGVMFILGVWACGVTGKALGEDDHSGMVWDEITAFLLVLFLTPPSLNWQAWAFLLFRLFDIIKPLPIGYYDKKLRGGFGVMFDDLLAAFLTLLCLAAWKAFAVGGL